MENLAENIVMSSAIFSALCVHNGVVVCGDFNEVLSQDEHVGPRVRTEAQINAF
jgi:hypothetical protein